MRMKCPHNEKKIGTSGNITIENRTVNICASICDSADTCDMPTCEYHDLSTAATRLFMEANAAEHASPIKRSMIVL